MALGSLPSLHRRMHAGLKFVYDCPDGALVDIFKQGTPRQTAARSYRPLILLIILSWSLDLSAGPSGELEVDKEAERKADDHNCAVKNSRGELMTVVVVPDGTATLPAAASAISGVTGKVQVEEQNIAMTRR